MNRDFGTSYEQPGLERSFLIGCAVAALSFILAAISGGSALGFFSPISFLLVVGGTVAATLIQFSLHDLSSTLAVVKNSVLVRGERVSDRVQSLLRLSQRVKNDGILVLEEFAATTADPFLRLGLELTVDGQNGEEIRRILEREISASDEQGSKAALVLEAMGSYAPALGLVGTVMGLIQMLGQLSTPEALGPAFSLALVSTLYGAVMANLMFFPLAGKIRFALTDDRQIKLVTVEALVSLAHQESSVILEQRLQSFRSLAVN